MDYFGFDAYEKSINKIGVAEIFMAKGINEDIIIVINGTHLGFKGIEVNGGILKVPLNHENAVVLRNLLPFTGPSRVLREDCSFGVGDRLGIATPGHIKAFEQYDVYPVLAQQSIRELNLTNRTFENVLDDVSFAVFREGFKRKYGADGDHLKTAKDVENALSLGFSMITLDCSDYIKNDIADDDLSPLPQIYADKYLEKYFNIGEGINLNFTRRELEKTFTIYGDALRFTIDIYDRFFKDGKYDADFEISIDETATPTTALQHFFVAKELVDAGVTFATIAPRFCGEFQKGIDYIGNLIQFEEELKIHAAIARFFKYKLSIHSGSDKFSVFPCIGKETKGIFHIKTSGTNWLEAMRVIAVKDSALYREIHNFAISVFQEAAKFYHVTTDLSKIPPLDKLQDSELPGLFNQNDARQLIHITYGYILSKKDAEGHFIFRDRLYKIWKEHGDTYNMYLVNHIERHLEALCIKRKPRDYADEK
jgi:hypothetical protein